MLDLNKLQIFLVVVQEGSFSSAADRLYVSQSAISQHIKDLEMGLGRVLFERGWRGVQLTRHGEILHEYARKIFALVAEAEAALTDVEHLLSGKIDIGATPGLSIYLVPDWMQDFRTRYPRLTVGLKTGITANIVADVLARHIELGFVEGEIDHIQDKRLASHVLETVKQVVVISKDHSFADKTQVTVQDLHNQRFIMRQPTSQTRQWLEALFVSHEVSPQVIAEFDNLESIKRSVASSMCMTVLPPYTVRDEVGRGTLHALPVDDAPFTRTLKIIWEADTHFSPVARTFLEILATQYPTLNRLLGK